MKRAPDPLVYSLLFIVQLSALWVTIVFYIPYV